MRKGGGKVGEGVGRRYGGDVMRGRDGEREGEWEGGMEEGKI